MWLILFVNRDTNIRSKMWFNYYLGCKLPASMLLHLNGIFLPYICASSVSYGPLCKANARQQRVKVLLSKCIPATQEHHVLLIAERQNSPKYLNLPNRRARLRWRTSLENKREEEPPGGSGRWSTRWTLTVHRIGQTDWWTRQFLATIAVWARVHQPYGTKPVITARDIPTR